MCAMVKANIMEITNDIYIPYDNKSISFLHQNITYVITNNTTTSKENYQKGDVLAVVFIKNDSNIRQVKLILTEDEMYRFVFRDILPPTVNLDSVKISRSDLFEILYAISVGGDTGNEERLKYAWFQLVLPEEMSEGECKAYKGEGRKYVFDTFTCFTRKKLQKESKVNVFTEGTDYYKHVCCVLFPEEYERLRETILFKANKGRELKYALESYVEFKRRLSPQEIALIESKAGSVSTHLQHMSTVRGMNISDLSLFYTATRDVYPNWVRMIVDGCLDDNDRIESKELSRVKDILSLYATKSSVNMHAAEDLLCNIDDALYKVYKNEVTAIIDKAYVTLEKRKGFRIALIGSKTPVDLLSNEIIKSLNLPTASIDINDCDDALILNGTDRTYIRSEAGFFADSMVRNSTVEMVFKIYSVDSNKCSNHGQKPMTVINNMFENNELKDRFMDGSIPIDKTFFICTACNYEDVYIKNPSSVFDAVIIIHELTEEDYCYLAEKKYIPELLTKHQYSGLKIPTNIVRLIFDQYCWDDDYRRMESCLNDVIALAKKRDINTVSRSTVVDALEASVNTQDIRVVAHRNRRRYSVEDYRKIRSLIKKYYEKDSKDEAVLKRLNSLVYLAADSSTADDEKFNYKKFISKLNETHYGLDSVKREIAASLLERQLKEACSNDAILFQGPPGVGKSSLAAAVSNAYGAKLVRIPFGDISHSSLLTGTPNEEGLIAKRLIAAGIGKKVLLLDEIDKTTEGAINVLIELLDISSDHRTLSDMYVGNINLNGVLIIATCNDMSKISPIVLNRFQYTFEIPDYTLSVKFDILKDRVIPAYVSTLEKSCGKITVEDEAILKILIKHRYESGIRVITSEVKREIKNAIARDYSHRSIIVHADDINDVEAKDYTQVEIPTAGVVNGLYVTDKGKSGALRIETVLLHETGTTIVTGLADESIKESVRIAETYIKTNYNSLIQGSRIHIHFNDSEVEKTGPSAGIAVVMSILSALMDKPLTHKCAMTGEITPTGKVLAIGSLYEKILAAKGSGCSCVYIPSENYQNAMDFNITGIKIIPIDSIDEVISKELLNPARTKTSLSSKTAKTIYSKKSSELHSVKCRGDSNYESY